MHKLVTGIFLKAIRLYQRTLSPDHGFVAVKYPHGFCQFYPSCSEYAYQAVERYGLLRGTGRGLWRILRCNPFSKGGVDPLPR